MPDEEVRRKRRGPGAGILLLPAAGLAASAIIYVVMRSKPAKLYGVVTDKDTILPVEGVKVALNGKVTHTNVLGYYQLANLDTKVYDITFEKDGYTTVYGTVSLAPGDNEVSIEMEPTGSLSEFVYASDLIIVRTDIPSVYDVLWEVSVQNIGEGAGILHLEIANRMDYSCGAYEFSSWHGKTIEDTIAPGETKKFSEPLPLNPYCYQIKVESEAGEIVKYWSATAS